MKFKFKHLMLPLLAVVLAGSLAACGTKSDSKKLVIYTNSASDGRGDWLKEKAKEKGFDLEIVEGGGGDIANRLIAEKNKPVADVIYGLSTMNYEDFKAQDMLEQYKPAWADEVSPGLNDKDDYYHGLVKQAILLIYNSKLYNEQTAPKDWTDLWTNPEFHGKYDAPAAGDLGGGTVRAVLAGILVRYQDPNGELGISKEGWDNLKEYLKYGYYKAEGEDFYANLASGKTPFGPMFSSGIASREQQYGVKAGLVKPEVGVPFVVEQVAIVKGTKNLDTAKAFVDWFGSAEVQSEWSQKFSTMPANTKALANASQDIRDMAASFKQQDIDWAFVSKNINKWVEKIQLELLP
jgi:iron(III) transport system substrate-binding protein